MARWLLAFLFLLSASLQAQKPHHPEKSPSAGKPTGAPASAEETWEIDTAHSKLGFDIRLFLGRSDGQFNTWSGTVTMPPGNWDKAAVNVVIQVASIHTDDSDRDDHLRNEDFFDVEKYPQITFKSTKVKRTGDSITVTGNLTMKDVTKSVVLTGKFLGAKPGPAPRMEFEASTTLNRRDYGVSYNRLAEGGGTMLGDEVKISMAVTVKKR